MKKKKITTQKPAVKNKIELPKIHPTSKDALIIIDLQNDFCPGGSVAVPEGDSIVPRINKIMPEFQNVLTTQDWHPVNHVSFHEQEGPWPSHCVQNTYGAELHSKLDQARVHVKIFKGTQEKRDAYSGFQGTVLAQELKNRGVEHVYLAGLATDYCVKATALDARRNGFQVTVLKDFIRAVNVKPGDGDKALEDMKNAGCNLL